VSLPHRFERRLESMVGSAFARVFKGQVEPVEIGSALQREATDKKSVMGNGQILVPNRYRVTLSDSDYERLSPWETQLTHSLAELVQEHLDDNGLKTIGDVEVLLALDSDLHTGVFGVASRMQAQAPPRRRPYDSMSMPVVPGNFDEYVAPYGASNAAPPAAPPMYLPEPEYVAPPIYAPEPQYPAPAGYPPEPESAPPHFDLGARDYAPTYAAETPPVQPPRRQGLLAHLVVDGTPRTLTLRGGSNIVGRGGEADLQVLDQGVSRRHLDVHISDGIATAYDLHSTNGTTVNGHPIDSVALQHGDVIRVGHTRLVYQQDS
jgi:hypothetical protein